MLAMDQRRNHAPERAPGEVRHQSADQDTSKSPREKRHPDIAGLLIAAVLLGFALVIFWDTAALRLASTYGLGPKAMPYVVAAGLGVLGVANAALAWRGDFPPRESVDIKAIALILGGLAALIATIGLGGGFIPATAILFAATATAFGRRAIHIDLVIGLVLGVAVFLLFDKLLTLALPAGPIERLLF
jgi:putative tricarboxylic transport membrane protein